MATKSAYTASAGEIFELFGDYLEGGPERAAVVLGSRRVGDGARAALVKSLAALGYGDDPCSFATLLPTNAGLQNSGPEIDANALFVLVEGLDPLFIVATDAHAADALARAYRCTFPLDASIRVLGRNGVAFENLETLVSTPQGKQRAWALLKALPKL